jgi:hypothetical protein
VDERQELAINPETGLKNYIATEGMGIDTSAALVRNLFGRCIDLGRQYRRSKDKKDLYEALRLIGTGSHCLEDYAAHSNYVELALIEMGERDIFPHVGRDTAIRLRGARSEVWPIVTGTFGGVDFLHSVCGEFDDKATQSEIQELEGALSNAEQSDGSVLRDLLSKVPSGLFGGKDEAGKVDELQSNAQAHQMQNSRISPRQPEEWTRYMNDVQKQIYPIMQWHDEVMQGLTETIEKLPILPDLIENIQDEINKFVFSLLAPYILPIIRQIQNELSTGSSEIINSSKNQQHIVFNDDRSSDPTHSMLSKDHFSNVLNEPAGKVASATVKWVVPQLIEAWDNDNVDIRRTLDRIINGVLHHPALRDQGGDATEGRRMMFEVVEKWWRSKNDREKDTLRRQLSRRGVENGENHKEGVQDHGHGSYRPQGQRFGIAGVTGGRSSGGGDYPIGQTMDALGDLVSGQGGSRPQQSYGGRSSGNKTSDRIGKAAGDAVGGGMLGGIVGGIASAVGADMLGGGLDENKETYKRESYGRDGSHSETFTQVGQSGNRYGQAQYTRTEDSHGGRSEGYSRFEQRPDATSYHHEERDQAGRYSEQTETYSGYSRTEQRSEYSSGGYGSSRRDDDSYGGRQEQSYGSSRRDEDSYASRHEQSYGSSRRDEDEGYSGREQQDYGSSRRDDDSYSGRQQQSYGRRDEDEGSSRRDEYGASSGGYGQSGGYGGSSYGREESGGYGQREEYGSSGRSQEYGSSGAYGRQEESYDSSGRGYGNDDEADDNRRRRDDEGYGQSGGYSQSSGYGGGGYGGSSGYDDNSGYGGSRY